MTLHIITWVWGSKYPGHYIQRLSNSVLRQSGLHLRIFGVSSLDRHLTEIQGCFARLRTFDWEWQQENGIKDGDMIACLDLDLVVTGSLSGLFDREEDFSILQGVNSSNPNPYNGSVWLLRAGTNGHVWNEFSLEAAGKVPYYAFPDDQAWFHARIPNAGSFGAKEGVYAFQKPGWPPGADLPRNARIVAFPGKRDPSQFTNLAWVRENWR